MEQKDEFLKRAEELYKDGNHEELLHLLKDNKLKKLQIARLFVLKGLVLGGMRKSSIPRAISAFTRAIELEANNAFLYRKRAWAWGRLKNHKKALADLATAISIAPRDPETFRQRANLLRHKGEFNEAKKDYSRAIRLNPKDPESYRNRKYLWEQLRQKSKQIKDLAKQLQLDVNSSADDHVDLGDLYYSRRQYEAAFKQYNKAIEKDSQVMFWEKANATLVTIFNILEPVGRIQKLKILRACVPISRLVNEIRDLASGEWLESPLVHYTKLGVADILLSDEMSKFRYYHVSYMNDPEEGNILLDIIDDPAIRKSYARGGQREENNFYLGSFVPESHLDELVMWRTYGKDEQGSEARGCSILIDRRFFREEPDAKVQTAENRPEWNKEKGKNGKGTCSGKEKNKKAGETGTSDDPTLREVIYYNKNTKKILGECGEKIKRELKELKAKLKEMIETFGNPETGDVEDNIHQAVDRIIYYVITELRYLFKSSDFAYENEERVIRYVRPSSDLVKIEGGNSMPRRLYVEAKKPIRKYIRKIVLGPRVVHPDQWIYLKVRAVKGGNDLQMEKSKRKFQ